VSSITAGPTLRLRLLGSELTISSDDDRWIEFLAQLWGPFLCPETAVRGDCIHIWTEGERWMVNFFGEWTNHATDPWSLAAAVRNAIVQRAEKRRQGGVPLHAGGVSRGDTLVLIAGPAGFGKTTLILELLQSGWAYFSDDLALIEPASGLVQPFPKPLHIRGAAAWNEHRILWAPPSWLPPPRESYLIPPSAFPLAEAPLAAVRLVFPVFQAGARLELRPLSPAESFARCLQNLRGDPQVVPLATATIRRLVEQAPAAKVRHGSATMAAQALQEWVL
jgi:hypothetical protein